MAGTDFNLTPLLPQKQPCNGGLNPNLKLNFSYIKSPRTTEVREPGCFQKAAPTTCYKPRSLTLCQSHCRNPAQPRLGGEQPTCRSPRHLPAGCPAHPSPPPGAGRAHPVAKKGKPPRGRRYLPPSRSSGAPSFASQRAAGAPRRGRRLPASLGGRRGGDPGGTLGDRGGPEEAWRALPVPLEVAEAPGGPRAGRERGSRGGEGPAVSGHGAGSCRGSGPAPLGGRAGSAHTPLRHQRHRHGPPCGVTER